uniref:Uncharacterized protein n=1 Tax=viral metagenome TaxID=1070528 RepID=A0A6C0F5Y6_9ZZZZ
MEDNRKVGYKGKPEKELVEEITPKKSAFRSKTKLPMGMDRVQSQNSQFLDPFQSSQEVALANQYREETYPGGASIGTDSPERRRVMLHPFPVHEMVRDEETGKTTTVLFTQEQLDRLRQERADAIVYFKREIRKLVKRSVLTRKGTNSLEEFKRLLEIVKGTYFDKDPSADYEYTPEDFSKKSKLYLEDLIELNEEYIELCKELLPEDPSQMASIQFAQNKLKRNLEQLIELLSESVKNEPDSEKIDGWNESIAKYQEMLRELGEEEPVLKAGGGSAEEEADFGGRKKPKRKTIKRKLTKKSKTRKLKNKRKTTKKKPRKH